MSVTFSQLLAMALRRHTDQAFGLMGNGNAHLIDSFALTGVRHVEVRHEAGAVAAADAFTRASGRIAIATATYGAGFTNMVTALAEAAMAHTPMIVVVGDIPTSGARPWDVDQAALAAAVGVETFTLAPHELESQVDRAIERSHAERRPVVLAIPYDLVAREVEPSIDSHHERRSPSTSELSLQALRVATDDEVFIEAVARLSEAKRPAIIAGHGAHLSGAGVELGHTADLLGALTGSTARARGMFPDAHHDLGIVGGFGQEAAMRVLHDADVVLVVGAGLNQFTSRFGELFGDGAAVIRVDTSDVDAPDSAAPITHVHLRGDARTVLKALNAALESSRTEPSGWREQFTDALAPGGELRVIDNGLGEHPSGRCDDGLLDPRAVAARIADLLPEDRYVTSDGGHFIGWANMFWPVASPERMTLVGTAYQTIGLGLPALVGVATAAPDSTAVLTTGDGGTLMALADLESAIRTASSAVIVVWNDGAYGAEVHLYGLMGLDQTSMLIPHVDFAGLANAFGAQGVRVTTLDDLDELGRWRDAGAQGTILLDCRISRSVVAPYQREIQQVNGVLPRD